MKQLSHPNCEHYVKTGCCALFTMCQIMHGLECYSMKPNPKTVPRACRSYARRAIQKDTTT